jgi:hypothetical protein
MVSGYEAAYLRALETTGAAGHGGAGALGLLRREYGGFERPLDRHFQRQEEPSGGLPATRPRS